MSSLIRTSTLHLKDFLKVSDDWQTSTETGVNLSVQKEWDISKPLKIDHIIYRYSGGSNGRIIAQHERSFVECSKHVINLHDHKYNKIFECVVKETCREIFIYISNTDELRVVTSSGRFFIFQGETIISNLPILSPELEPKTDNKNDQESQPSKRNREIIDVAFWETGFVYIDRDGYIVEYQLDNSNIQIFNQNNYNNYSSEDETPDKYKANIESAHNMHTRIISSELKSIGIPICFDVVPPSYTGLPNNSPYVFVAGSTNELYILSYGNMSTIKLPSSIISLSFSHSYKLVAIIVDPMILLVVPINFDSLYLRLEIDEGDVFEQLSWLGDDIPIISFNEVCFLVLQNSEMISIPTDSIPLIIKQSNSALIFTSNALYRASMISESLSRCFGAVKAKEKETPALKLIRSFCSYSHEQVLEIKKNGELEKAIKDCVESAQQIPNDISNDTKKPDNQTILMMAACFGRSYTYTNVGNDTNDNRNVDTEMTEEFVKATRWIRLANFFRKELNISVTPKELRDNSSPDDAIARICCRGLFSPAFEVADEFSADKSLVVTRWCSKIIEKVKDDNFCYKCLIHMKKSLTKNDIKSNSLNSQAPIIFALNKMKNKNDDFGQNENSELDEDRTTCSLFDTASIASACLIRGRTKLASKIANNELNSMLVIPFFAASGLWKEALIAAANTWDSNILIEVLKKAISSTSQFAVFDAIENHYFAYSTAIKLYFFWRKRMIDESIRNKDESIENRRRNRSRNVNKSDIEIYTNISDNEYFSQSIDNIMKTEPRNQKVLDLYVKNKLRFLTTEIDLNPKSDAFELVRKTDDDLKKICLDYPNLKWASNQAELTTLETKLINLYQKLVKIIDFENANSKSINYDKVKNLKFNDLTVNSLIRTAVDSGCFLRLIELAKTENFDEFSPKVAVSVAANHMAKSGKFNEFKSLFTLSEAPFVSQFRLLATIALHYFGKDKAIEFVNAGPDGKEKQAILNLLGSASQINVDMQNPLYAMPFDIYGTSSISTDLFKASLIGR